jgi:transposase
MKKSIAGILGVDKGPISAKGKKGKRPNQRRAIGLDLGDKSSCYCMLERGANEDVEVSKEGKVATTGKGIENTFGSLEPCLIALAVGTHSPWVSRLLTSLGHEVIVANARKVKAISQNSKKNDRVDAHMLARLALLDRTLLCPIQHRGEQAQWHLMEIRARAALVEVRTSLINAARGLVKASGDRLPACDADQMGVKQTKLLRAALPETRRPMLESYQRRRYVSAEAAGARSALHYGPAGTGYGFATLGPQASRTRWQERQEARHCGSGEKAVGAVALLVDDGRSVRTVTQ